MRFHKHLIWGQLHVVEAYAKFLAVTVNNLYTCCYYYDYAPMPPPATLLDSADDNMAGGVWLG